MYPKLNILLFSVFGNVKIFELFYSNYDIIMCIPTCNLDLDTPKK